MIGFALNGCGSSCIAGIMGGFLTIYLTDNLLLSMGFITRHDDRCPDHQRRYRRPERLPH